MNIQMARNGLMWCAIINYGLLLWWFLYFMLAHDWMHRFSGSWFHLSVEQFDAINFAGILFGYDGSHLYFHTAAEGMKIDYIAGNNQVCFELEHDVRVIADDNAACKWSMSFYSVIGFGTVEEITDSQSKIYALAQIMKHYSDREWDFPEQIVEKTRLWRIAIERITGKQSKDRVEVLQ